MTAWRTGGGRGVLPRPRSWLRTRADNLLGRLGVADAAPRLSTLLRRARREKASADTGRSQDYVRTEANHNLFVVLKKR